MSEHERHSGLWSWAIIVGFSAIIVAWGLAQFRLIPDAPREFDYGALKDVPGQSQYSVEPAPPGTSVPRQLQTLPEAMPVKGTPKPADTQLDRRAP